MNAKQKPPLRWTGVLFALAANMLLVTVSRGLVQALGMPYEFNVLETMVAPVVAGVLTAFYVPYRGAMHAFLGGMISIPLLGLFVLDGAWQFAIFAGAFCTLGGAITELLSRRRA